MSQTAKERIRKQMLDALKSEIGRQPFHTSMLTDEEDLSVFVDGLNRHGTGNQIQLGTNADGNLLFMVAFSAVGGTDVVGG